MSRPLLPYSLGLLGVYFSLIITSSAEFIRTEGDLPDGLPKAPFDLPVPEPKDSPDEPIKPEVVARASTEALMRGSYRFRHDGDLTRAIYLRSQAYKKSPTLRGKLELATWCAEAKDIDSAIYWLQQAALTDHLDEAMTEEALQPVRDDERWAKLKPFLEQAEITWKTSSYWRTVLVVPAGYEAKKPIPVLFTLHGWGSVPEDFVDDPAYQAIADQLQIAILGVSGTKAEGKHRFAWREKFEDDWKHIEKVLARLENKLTPAKGKCLAMGFSQGAQLSAELAAAYPDMFAGAIIMGPGYRGPTRLPEALKLGQEAVGESKFIVTYNQEEHPATIAASKSIIGYLGKTKAGVFHHAFTGDTHSSPPYLDEHLSLWIQFLSSGKPSS